MNDIARLKAELDNVFVFNRYSNNEWLDARVVARMVEVVQSNHVSAAIVFSYQTIEAAITKFRQTREISSFRELKYICVGTTTLMESNWSLVCDERLWRALIQLVAEQDSLRKKIKCFQALLFSYWTYPLYNNAFDAEQRQSGVRRLRAWLLENLIALSNLSDRLPLWFETISDHRNLLSENPCARYTDDLILGDREEIEAVINRLSVPSESWMFEELVLAHIRRSAEQNDNEFAHTVDDILKLLVTGETIAKNTLVCRKAISLIMMRYSQSELCPEHLGLRNAALSIIGNPWIDKSQWEAWVIDEAGLPNEKARLMVDGWLKRKLIDDFFKLMSADESGDSRRLKYWLRFEPLIDDMWFALGKSAYENNTTRFKEFKQRAKGRRLSLKGTSSDNNAFIMKIGRYYAIEFGSSGNAFYLYDRDSVSGDFKRVLNDLTSTQVIDISDLKRMKNPKTMSHIDKKYETWEKTFDGELLSHLRTLPEYPESYENRHGDVERSIAAQKLSESFSERSLKEYAARKDLQVDDYRQKNGCLWIRNRDVAPDVREQLTKWQFKYGSSGGWWRK